MYIFLHIPRTGGTLIHESIKNNFDNIIDKKYFRKLGIKISSLLRNKKEIPIDLNHCYFHGHVRYGMHEVIKSNMEVKYFTVLRDPIERTISTFSFLIQRFIKPKRISIKNNKILLKIINKFRIDHDVCNLASSFLNNNISTNIMCKQLSGMVKSTDIKSSADEINKLIIFSPFVRTKKYTDEQMSEILFMASKNLGNMDFVLLLDEHIIENIKKICQIKKWQFNNNILVYKKSDRKISRMIKQNKKAMEVIKKMNYYDIKFYEYAVNYLKSVVSFVTAIHIDDIIGICI